MSEFQLIPESPKLRAARLIEAALNDKRLHQADLSYIMRLARSLTATVTVAVTGGAGAGGGGNENQRRASDPVDLQELQNGAYARGRIDCAMDMMEKPLPIMSEMAVRDGRNASPYPTWDPTAPVTGRGQAGTKRQFPDTLDEAAQVRCMIGDPQLQDVLELHIADGRPAGAQMLSSERVIAWIGDVQQDGRPVSDGWRLWLYDEPTINTPLLFRDCRGSNALEQAAKWLYEQWELRS